MSLQQGRSVYVTGEGEAYHLDADCPQFAADSSPTKKSVGDVEDGRRRCSICGWEAPTLD